MKKNSLLNFLSDTGYKRNSPDVNRPLNVIPSGRITMQDVDFPVRGVDNLGNEMFMMPGGEYFFLGDYVVETPMMQRGGLTFQQYYTPASESTGANYTPTMTVQAAERLKAMRDAQELARRKQAIQASQAAASRSFRERLTPENLAQETGATGDKLRFFPNDPDSFIDDYLNPLKMVGDMASGLGRIPLNVKQGNYGAAALDVAIPVATGALAGLGAKSAGQFVNNLANPLAGTGQFLTTKTPLRNAYKYNPWAFKPNVNSAYRMIGDERGLASALESGYLQPSKTGSDIGRVHKETHYQIGAPSDTREYFGRTWDRGYKGPYMVEVPNSTTDIRFSYGPSGKKMGSGVWTYDNDYIPLSEAKFYKQDWLRGYKEVPKQLPGSPNAFKSEIDWAKWNPETPKPAWQMQEMPGLHLKSTMEGETISKIVEPKTGLVNVEQALGIIGKESGGADKVALIKQGLGDNIPKKMDFNDFRKTVQDQLIPLERQFSTQASNYGVGRLGYPSPKRSSYEAAIKHNEEMIAHYKKQIAAGSNNSSLRGDLQNAINNLENSKKELATLPLENQTLILGNKSKFGRGSGAHGNPDETLGHIHFLRDAETPDVLTVTQIQSDAFQGTHRIMPKTQQEALEKVSKLKEEGVEIKSMFGDGKESSNSVLANYEKHLQLDEASAKNFTQKQLLDKNHQERYLQELVAYAGERGDVNKVRVPTSETAAKVQGYKPVITSEEIIEKYNKLKGTREWDEIVLDTPDADKVRFEKVLKGEIKGDIYELDKETILKKYKEQPKTIKKLFGVEPKIVTDSKGNSWYEFDIPDKAKKGKMEIKAFTTTGAVIGVGALQETPQYQKGGQQVGTDILDKYKSYIMGDYKPEEEKDLKNTYDKLNRHYYKKAKETGKSVPNYIMSLL